MKTYTYHLWPESEKRASPSGATMTIAVSSGARALLHDDAELLHSGQSVRVPEDQRVPDFIVHTVAAEMHLDWVLDRHAAAEQDHIGSTNKMVELPMWQRLSAPGARVRVRPGINRYAGDDGVVAKSSGRFAVVTLLDGPVQPFGYHELELIADAPPAEQPAKDQAISEDQWAGLQQWFTPPAEQQAEPAAGTEQHNPNWLDNVYGALQTILAEAEEMPQEGGNEATIIEQAEAAMLLIEKRGQQAEPASVEDVEKMLGELVQESYNCGEYSVYGGGSHDASYRKAIADLQAKILAAFKAERRIAEMGGVKP